MAVILKTRKLSVWAQRRYALGLVLLSTSFSPWARETLVGQEVPIQEFIDLLDDATAAQDRHFANAGMKIKYHKLCDIVAEKPRKIDERIEFEYKASKPLWQLRSIKEGDNADHIFVINNEGCFSLARPKGQDRYKVTQFSEDRDWGVDQIMYSTKVPRAPCCFWNIGWVDVYKKGFLKHAKIVRSGDFCKTRYEANKPGAVFSGELVFRLINKMSQVEHRRFGPKEADGYWKQTVEYEGEADGIPLVKRVEVSSKDHTGTCKEVWEVLEWIPGPFPASDFTLENFGITDYVPPGYVPRWYYVIAGCLVLIFVGAVLWRVRRSKRSSTGPSNKTGAIGADVS